MINMMKELKHCAMEQGYGSRIGKQYFVDVSIGFDLRDIWREELKRDSQNSDKTKEKEE